MARLVLEAGAPRRTSWAVGVSAGLAVLALGAASLVSPASAATAPSGSTTTTTTQQPAPRPIVKPSLPKVVITVAMTPKSGSVVGIGYPITARFSSPIARRGVAEQHMHVLLNGKQAAGAWYWKNSTTALFRMRSFWPGHAVITVRLALAGVELTRSTSTSYVGSSTSTRVYVMRTARSFIARVSATTHRMKVYVDGTLVKDFGVSLGKAGFETRSGIKTTMDKYANRHMTSQMLGLTDPADQYDLNAPWATRITYSGEFVHGAPWAAGRIGRWNGSHGCTNLLTTPAKWFYDATVAGDVVVTTGTTRTMEYWNSIGAVYNMPWSAWLARSATKGRW